MYKFKNIFLFEGISAIFYWYRIPESTEYKRFSRKNGIVITYFFFPAGNENDD